MTEIELNRPRLAHVLEGFPVPLVPQPVQQSFERFCLDLDALGRMDRETGTPLIDAVTLTAMLREFVDHDLADKLVALLDAPADCAFRVDLDRGRYDEVSWFELAREVVIFDSQPDANFAELRIPETATVEEVIKAVQARFPSMEEEMIDPEILARQVIKRLQEPGDAEAVLRIISRQLGWWAALVTVLMLPPAVVATRVPSDNEASTIVWPLAMNALAAGVGGWTLTVIGSCLLAPLHPPFEERQ